MKVERIDHIHLFVKNIEGAMKFFSNVLGIQFIGPIDKRAHNPNTKVKVAFGDVGIEMVSPTSSDYPVAKYIDEHGEGLAAIAFKVPDLEEAIAELEAKGVRLDHRGSGIRDIKVAVFKPEDAYGVIIELVQYDDMPSVAIANLNKMGELPWFKG